MFAEIRSVPRDRVVVEVVVEDVRPVPNAAAIENMKFTECLSPELAAEVFCARFNDMEAVRKMITKAMENIAKICSANGLLRTQRVDQMDFGFGGVHERELGEQVYVPTEGDGYPSHDDRNAQGAPYPDFESQ